MSLIDTEESATRLAKAIVADIRLYHEADVAAGADLTAVLQEGRELFRGRVLPSLHPLYEDAIAGLAQGRPRSAATLAPVEKLSGNPLPTGLFEGEARPSRTGPSWWLICFALLLAMSLGWLIAQR